MKKFIALVSLAGLLVFGTANTYAQGADKKDAAKTEQVTDTTKKADTTAAAVATTDTTAMAAAEEDQSFHQVMKEKFIEGGAGWMAPILLCLILGLALVIERIIYLNMATTNTDKLLNKVESALATGGVTAAKEVCKNTRGPVAGIYYQGLDRAEEGIDMIEKTIVSYGGVLMARLEKNLSWISLFIALGPMLGFLGTVVGMVQAFDSIEKAGDISPTVVAAGMKVALLTTVFGLIVAIILQVFYNYLVNKVENLVNSMEDASISFMDIMVKYERKNK